MEKTAADSKKPTGKVLSQSQLINELEDTGAYSLCGLCAQLFIRYVSEERHRKYLEKVITELVQYYGLPDKVGQSLKVMFEEAVEEQEFEQGNDPKPNSGGGGGDLNSYIKLIHNQMKKKNIPEERIVQDMVLFGVHNGVYDARLRVVICKLAKFLDVQLQMVEVYEQSLVEMLSDDSNDPEEDEQKKRRDMNTKIKRYALIALASVGGGVILGLTGGLSAPLIAAGATAITSGAAVLGTPAGVAIIGSLFGVAGAGLTGFKMNKRVGNIEEFKFEPVTDERALHLTIAISGWITNNNETAFTSPWQTLEHSQEQYSLRYESSYLLELGRAFDYFLSFAVSMAAQEALKYTLLGGLITAIAWPAALLTVSSVIDNPWGVCLRRSQEVGKYLADILISRQQGQRPVSLIGYSLGARVIFFCLEEMANRKDADGIIEDVILMGGPISASTDRWNKILPIINGRFVNVYCDDDWLLKFLYRTSTATLRIAGLQEVGIKNRKLENYNVSEIVKGHMDYCSKIDEILEFIGVRIDKAKRIVEEDQEKDEKATTTKEQEQKQQQKQEQRKEQSGAKLKTHEHQDHDDDDEEGVSLIKQS